MGVRGYMGARDRYGKGIGGGVETGGGEVGSEG